MVHGSVLVGSIAFAGAALAAPQKPDYAAINAAPQVANGPGIFADAEGAETAALATSFTIAGPAVATAAANKRDSLEKRINYIQGNIVNNIFDSAYNTMFGWFGTTTTVAQGAAVSISGGSTHNFFGNINNSGNITVGQSTYLQSNPYAGGQTSDWVGHDILNGNLNNAAGASIVLNDFGSASAPTYDWYLRQIINNGNIQWCGRGDTGGSTYQMYSDLDSTNNGLISFEQYYDNLGASFVWRNPALTTSYTISNLYNNGAFRLINVVFHNVQNIYGSGCWVLGKGAVLYLEDGTGAFQNPTAGPSFPGQSISFQDSSAILHMDTAVYSRNSNFGATLYGFGAGNAIEFYQIISGFSYSGSILNVRFVGGYQVNIKVGAGYSASGFYQGRRSTHYNVAGYNAIMYNGAVPAQSAPGKCQVSAPICSGPSAPATSSSSVAPPKTSSSSVEFWLTWKNSATSSSTPAASSSPVKSSSIPVVSPTVSSVPVVSPSVSSVPVVSPSVSSKPVVSPSVSVPVTSPVVSPSVSSKPVVSPSVSSVPVVSPSISSKPVVSPSISVPVTSSSSSSSVATSSSSSTVPSTTPLPSCPSSTYTPYYPALATSYTTNPALTGTTTAGQACPTQPEAGTYCGFINPEDPCAPQPDGYGPVPTPDTVSAFYADPQLASEATAAPTVIASTYNKTEQYNQVFVNLEGSTSASSYLGMHTLDSYDPATCAAFCDCTDLCKSFNVYAERDPSLNPSKNDSTAATVWGYWCPNPPSMTTYKCTLWGSVIDNTTATNMGQWREDFQVVVTASDGWTLGSVPPPTPSGSAPPKTCGGKGIDAPNYHMGGHYFPGPFNPDVCSDYANKQQAANTQAGSSQSVKCYNAYYLHKNGKPHGTQCNLYNTVPSIDTYATYSGEWSGSDQWEVKESWLFTLL